VHAPWRGHTQGTLQPADVPVGLRGRRHRGRLERPVQPHRIDLGQTAEGAEHGSHRSEQADRAQRVRLPKERPDDVALGASGPAELGVLLTPEDGEVGCQQGDDESRHQQDVEDEQAPFEGGGRELPAEEQERQPRTEDGDAEHDRVGDAQAGPRQEVVGQRVAREPVGDGEQQERDADDPVQLAGAAERAREEDAA